MIRPEIAHFRHMLYRASKPLTCFPVHIVKATFAGNSRFVTTVESFERKDEEPSRKRRSVEASYTISPAQYGAGTLRIP